MFKERLKGVDITVDQFYHVFETGMTKRAKWVTVWKEDTLEFMLEQGRLACEGFHKYWRNRFDPLYVEYQFNVDRGKGKLPIMCITDLITKDHKVIDWKFGKSAKIGDYLLNMATYSKCYYDIFGEIPEVAIVKQKWSRKKQPNGKFKYFFDGFAQEKLPVTQDWFKYFTSVYDDVEKGIKSGVWVTASDNNGLCRECHYRKTGVCDVVLLPWNQ